MRQNIFWYAWDYRVGKNVHRSLFKADEVDRTDATVTDVMTTEFSTNEYQRDYFNSDSVNSTKIHFVSLAALMISFNLL